MIINHGFVHCFIFLKKRFNQNKFKITLAEKEGIYEIEILFIDVI